MSRVAAIDIGTNSTRLLVADGSGAGLEALEIGLVTTRLGEGIGGGVLLPGAMDRTVEAVDGFYRKALGLGAERVVAAATSAVRDASNREEFLDRVKRRTGLPVRVLSGEEEAAMSYRGVLSGLAVEPSTTAVVDIGGGSTELIWSRGGTLCLNSVKVGAVRMTEAGLAVEEIGAILRPVLAEVRRSRITGLVGVGGTVTTLAAIDQCLVVYSRDRVHGYSLSADRVDGILQRLKRMSAAERRQVPGLQPERADIIVAGVAIVKGVLEGLELDRLLVSECDILYGLALEEVERK
jgi:exopolyphosphatase/guanosine-5'-triphosphate,3'-diphosphate pyrophosphatase